MSKAEPINDPEDIFRDQPRDLVPVARTESLDMMKAAEPEAVVKQGQRIAKALSPIIKQGQLSVKIGQGEHVKAEGWTTMLAMLGILPRQVPERSGWLEGGAYEATVELVNAAGQVVGRATAECGHEDDKPWNKRPRYARRSMAITRATGKAARMGFSWIMVLSGFSATPAEEMQQDSGEPPTPPEPIDVDQDAAHDPVAYYKGNVPEWKWGKAKGKLVTAIESGYLRWAADNMKAQAAVMMASAELARLELASDDGEPPF